MARRIIAALLVLLGVLLAPVAVGARWAESTLTSAEQFAATVEPLADDPLVQQTIDTAVGDALIGAIDAEQRLSQVPLLPDTAVEAIAAGVNSAIRSEVEQFVAGERFVGLWVDLTGAVREELMAAVDGERGGALALEEGRILLDTGMVADQVKAQLAERGVPFVGDLELGVVEGQVQLAEAPNLQLVIDALRIFLPVAAWLWVVAAALVVGGVLLWSRRSTGLMWAGLGLAVTCLLTWLSLGLATAALSGSAATPTLGALLSTVMDTLLAFLNNALLLVATLGLAMLVGGWLGGGSASGARVRLAITDAAHRWGAPLAEGPVGQAAARQPLLVPVLRGAVLALAALWLVTRDLLTPSVLAVALLVTVVALLVVEVVEGAGRVRDAGAQGAQVTSTGAQGVEA